MSDDTGSRIKNDDVLITVDEMRKIMGGISISTAYVDSDLMALKINMTPPGRRTKRVRFIQREVHALRAERAERSAADATNVRAQIEARVAQRRDKQRLRLRAVKADA
jgi:hypothetical protein